MSESMSKEEIADRVRRIAKSTDGLIARLDTLSNRIDTAAKNDNRELVEYYQKLFTEVSAEFMGGIETMIDDWYQLRGEKRPVSSEEYLSQEMLDEIHSAMVNLVHGASVESVVLNRLKPAAAAEQAAASVDIAINGDGLNQDLSPKAPSVKKPGNRVDITG